MTYKIVFSDIDGTLLNSKHQLLPNTLISIRILQQKIFRLLSFQPEALPESIQSRKSMILNPLSFPTAVH